MAAGGWTARSGKQAASRTVSATKGAAANVRSWRVDQIRRNVVTLALIGCLVATASVVGVFGGPDIRDQAIMAPDRSLVSPGSYSIFLWAPIYLGLIGYTVHQWLPSQQDSPRHRGLGWIVTAAMLLTLGLALSVQSSELALSLVLLGLLLGVLLLSLRWLNHWSAATRLEGTLVDTPLGLFLGWTGFTALTHTAAVLSEQSIDWLGAGGFVWALVGLGVLVIGGCVVCSTDRGRIAVALAIVWGLGFILIERLIGQPMSLPAAAVTALAGFLVLITAGSRRHRIDHSYRRALRARQTAALPPLDLAEDEDPWDDER